MVDTTNTICSGGEPQSEFAAAGAPALVVTREHVENGSGQSVCVVIGDRVRRPSDKILPDRPYLGDLFDAIAAGREPSDDLRIGGTEYMNVELTEDERSRLCIWPGETVGGELWRVFFASDRE
jgi:hypothetical protein